MGDVRPWRTQWCIYVHAVVDSSISGVVGSILSQAISFCRMRETPQVGLSSNRKSRLRVVHPMLLQVKCEN